ncbi:MAG TPA: endonuclease/exonuclease/phosphatase family protein [Vicinamibacteria bacterium]|nr:endonuclease/exonuclease/phosphatase family protein [Vicinamibacteria bacterium]
MSGWARPASHRRRMGRLALWAALACPACATASNYLDPDGPRYEARYGQPQGQDPDLRVVTFNIENGRRIAEAVAGLRGHAALRAPDLLLLQEMNAAGVEAIARELAMNAVYFPASRLGGRDLGNAVLSPWPIEASWKLLLPHTTRIVKKARAAVAARVKVDGRAVIVYSVHLGSPLGLAGDKRREQAEAVLADAQRHPDDPVVVAGDFNSRAVGEVFERAGYAWPTKALGKTTAFLSIDHIFSRGLATRPEGAAGVAREVRDASDHRPVWAVLASPPPPAPGAGTEAP